jgi:hypothetical protein
VFERRGHGINGENDFIMSPTSGRGRFLLDSTLSNTEFKQKNLLQAIATTIYADVGDYELNPYEIDSFIVEFIGGPGSAAECTFLMEVYTRLATSYRKQVYISTNIMYGTPVYNSLG